MSRRAMTDHFQEYNLSSDLDHQATAAEKECARLRYQHIAIQDAAGGRLIWAPLEAGDNDLAVLDSAGADGTWCRALRAQMGDRGWFLTTDIDACKFPADQVTAAAGQLKGSGEEFLVHDFTASSWPEELHNRFDIVHQRLALAGSGSTTIATTLQRMAALLKQGTGWLHLVELDISPQEGRDRAMEEFVALLNAVTVATGVRPYFAAGLKQDLIQAGFVDVSEEILKVSAGCGIKRHDLAKASVEGTTDFCVQMTSLANKLRVQVDEDLPERLRETLEKQGSWMVLRIVVGRKP